MRENRARAYSRTLEHYKEQQATTMASAKSITTDHYKLFPSPRNRHRALFQHEVFVPYPYMLIDLESYNFKGKYSLFAAYRLSDQKNGQLVTLDLLEDEARFKARFVPD